MGHIAREGACKCHKNVDNNSQVGKVKGMFSISIFAQLFSSTYGLRVAARMKKLDVFRRK